MRDLQRHPETRLEEIRAKIVYCERRIEEIRAERPDDPLMRPVIASFQLEIDRHEQTLEFLERTLPRCPAHPGAFEPCMICGAYIAAGL